METAIRVRAVRSALHGSENAICLPLLGDKSGARPSSVAIEPSNPHPSRYDLGIDGNAPSSEIASNARSSLAIDFAGNDGDKIDKFSRIRQIPWIPACAGMTSKTGRKQESAPTNSEPPLRESTQTKKPGGFDMGDNEGVAPHPAQPPHLPAFAVIGVSSGWGTIPRRKRSIPGDWRRGDNGNGDSVSGGAVCAPRIGKRILKIKNVDMP